LVSYRLMSEIKVMAFVGMPGSGKGTCTDYLSRHYGFPVIHFGNMLYEEMQARGLDNIRDEGWFRVKIRDDEGPAVLARLASKKARESLENGSEKVVLDGLYSWSEYKYLEQEFGEGLTLIAVSAPRRLRYGRILNRRDPHRKYNSASQIRDREIQEIEDIEKGGPIAFADYTVVNDGSREKLFKEIDKIMAEIGSEPA